MQHDQYSDIIRRNLIFRDFFNYKQLLYVRVEMGSTFHIWITAVQSSTCTCICYIW